MPPIGVPNLNALVAAGYPYELAGIVYYIFFLMMSRKRFVDRYSLRSRMLVVIAAIAMVGCVPLHYAGSVLGVAVMYGLAVLALLSTIVDGFTGRSSR